MTEDDRATLAALGLGDIPARYGGRAVGFGIERMRAIESLPMVTVFADIDTLIAVALRLSKELEMLRAALAALEEDAP